MLGRMTLRCPRSVRACAAVGAAAWAPLPSRTGSSGRTDYRAGPSDDGTAPDCRATPRSLLASAGCNGATAEDPGDTLEAVVPKQDYRDTFLKLTRNLAPTGKSFDRLVSFRQLLENSFRITFG